MLQDLEDLLLTGNEYPEHRHAKKRLAKILRKKGFITFYEVSTGITETEVGPRNYTIDLWGIWQHTDGRITEIAFEVDGHKGHHSKRNRDRDKFRDRVHWEYKKIPTIRLNRFWLAGRDKVTDDDIWIEILWQLRTKYGIKL